MKFSIRDLFLVTMIVALAVAWWLDHRWQKMELDRIQVSQRKSQESVGILTKLIEEMGYTVTLPNSPEPAPNPPKP